MAAEIMCQRIAHHQGEVLPTQFWLDPCCEPHFRRQIAAASRLLKVYDAEAVFRTLEANPNVRSLKPYFVADLVEAERDRIDRSIERAELAAPIEAHDPCVAPRQGVRRGESGKSRLRRL
jgi:hypothetical protein